MKVFLSWSGEISHKVALALRDWLPSVIQDVVPYVSSEDIDKGTRWSSDIAAELEESTFGILCVTKENLSAPWLCFEAGALSKTIDKAYVSPFLFDIKRSEVSGPILQFQSTIFEKDDVFKLISTVYTNSINTNLNEERLKKTFDVWWPSLEEELSKIKDDTPSPVQDTPEEVDTSRILEEILELSRLNQKLLRDPEISVREQLHELQTVTDRLYQHAKYSGNRDKKANFSDRRSILRMFAHRETPEFANPYMRFQLLFSLARDRFPWIHEEGMELVRTLRRDNYPENRRTFEDFVKLVRFTFRNPELQESMRSKEDEMFYDEYAHFLLRELDAYYESAFPT